jgi:hypothetical protein
MKIYDIIVAVLAPLFIKRDLTEHRVAWSLGAGTSVGEVRCAAIPR